MTPTTTLSDKSVLYVEDEVIVAIEVAEGLRDLGFETVEVAHNLRSSERLVAKSQFDFAVLDVNLGNGERTIELGQRLAETGCRVIFASGYNRAELSPEIRDFEFLEKPVSIADIKSRLLAIADSE